MNRQSCSENLNFTAQHSTAHFPSPTWRWQICILCQETQDTHFAHSFTQAFVTAGKGSKKDGLFFSRTLRHWPCLPFKLSPLVALPYSSRGPFGLTPDPVESSSAYSLSPPLSHFQSIFPSSLSLNGCFHPPRLICQSKVGISILKTWLYGCFWQLWDRFLAWIFPHKARIFAQDIEFPQPQTFFPRYTYLCRKTDDFNIGWF